MARAIVIIGIVGGFHFAPGVRFQPVGSTPSLSVEYAASATGDYLRPNGGPAWVASVHGPRPPADVVSLSTTSYCQSGTTADGQQTHFGEIAMNGIPFGTRVELLGGTFAGTVFTVEDRIGWGSELDVFQSSCSAAWNYGREQIPVLIEA